ncbi:hypothetical protein QE152_g26106 [Popillia japonica]|uniref:Uncharacterized protein n=1 Tax=Popillia japonica TaxID=7064 RepID=A0AAW1JZV7_POPJA
MARPPDYSSTEEPSAAESMWGMETGTGAECDSGTGAECDCPGPPPEFLLPPPPRPPILQPQDPLYCSEEPLSIETCDALPITAPAVKYDLSNVTVKVRLGIF